MKNSLKLLLIAAGAIGVSMANTACTPTEAALVGAATGAVIGYAVADDHYDDSYYHGGHYGYRGGYYGGHYGYRGGYYGGRRGYCY